MKEPEPEQPQKDEEVEISNLDPSPTPLTRTPRFSARQRTLIVISLNALLIVALVLILVNTAPVHNLIGSVFARPTPVPTSAVIKGPTSVLFPTFPSHARLGAPGCNPPSPLDPSNFGLPEAPGTAPARNLWVLFVNGIPAANSDNKIVWRIDTQFVHTPDIIGLGPNGQHLQPLSIDEHSGSDWNRPGVEWGTVFNFPVKGCWDLHVAAGTPVGDVWIVVS